MAVLKTYQRQVQTSGDAGTGRAIDTGSAKVWDAVGGITKTVAGVVGEVRQRNDIISTIAGKAEWELGQQVLNDKISKRVQQIAQEDKDYTPEEILSATQEIRDQFSNDFEQRIAPKIKDPMVLAQMKSSIDASNGKFGVGALDAAYGKHRVAHTLNKLEMSGVGKIDAGNYDGAMKDLENARAAIGEDQYIRMSEVYKKAKDTVVYNESFDRIGIIEQSYSDGGATFEQSLTSLEELEKQVTDSDIGAGQKGNIKRSIGASKKRIESARVTKHKQTADKLIDDVNAGGVIDRIEIQQMLDDDKIDEVGAKRIATAVWKRDAGVATTENNAIYGLVTGDIKNGRITSFDQLEAKKFEMTPTQYDQAERELADKLGEAAYPEIDVFKIQNKLGKKDATVVTLSKEIEKIQKARLPSASKEALTIIAENAFAVSKNPELAEGYAGAVADIMKLERYLGLSPGGIAFRLRVYKDMDVEELTKRKDMLKKAYDDKVQDKIKETLSRKSFTRQNKPTVSFDDVLNEVFGAE